ncbi:MAG: hypothetical protein GYA35_05025 [Thermoanaerobaculaceae bacterium]|nr:hypothetical protein [Thermoanaerobaculaceae bacterium]
MSEKYFEQYEKRFVANAILTKGQTPQIAWGCFFDQFLPFGILWANLKS